MEIRPSNGAGGTAPGAGASTATATVPANVYAERREELMRRLGPNAVAIVHGSREQRRNSDVDYRYRQPSDLLYLTGFEEPEAVAVLTPGRKERFTLFVRPRDKEREVWTGRRLGVEGAVARLGADAAHPIAELSSKLFDLADGATELHYLFGDDKELEQLIMSTLSTLRAHERRGKRAPRRTVDLRTTLHEMRLLKDPHALAQLRRAVDITTEAHVTAMKTVRPGMYEYEIEALVDYTFRRLGGAGPGYGTIVGGGENATILHYTENTARLTEGTLLLIDAGGEFGGFTADVTRTYPVSGRFSPVQRRFYEVVLRAEKECVALVRPGATIEDVHDHAVKVLTAGMVELGLLQGSVSELIEKETYKRYYLHRTSHWLGMDVHDVGTYYAEGGPDGSRAFVPGMVLTVEPGLYVAADDTEAPAELRGLGVRIEDDVLVTADGHEVLTRHIPKDVDDIEALMARGRANAPR
jgi:Xaa-Pro aminopeptidase